MKRLIIGLTGGICAGKSAAEDCFKKISNTKCINTDNISKEILTNNKEVIRSIINKFPETRINKEQINRPKLKEIIFNKKCNRIWLNNMVHPLVYEKIHKYIKENQENNIVISIPLLANSDIVKIFDRILLIDAKLENRIKRITERDGIAEKEAIKIINSQPTRKENLKIAHDVLINDGTKIELEDKVKKINKKYLLMVNKT